jgi:2-polyprenyl-3-methyl-5-hydroxy-6-metoxy-1,4-benzoquinol methylase
MKIYADKTQDYFSSARLDLIPFIPAKQNNKILELGAGGGDTLVKIKQLGLASEVVGVELFDMPGSNQNHETIDQLIIGNIEYMDLNLPENYFDAIICGDVLEHLIDPWAVVKKVVRYLKKDGVMIVSAPNLREYKTLSNIVFKGDFSYTKAGIMDKTHLRFFCKKNLIDLLDLPSLKLVKVASNIDPYAATTKTKIFNAITFNLFYDFFVTQFYLVARKI